MPANSVTPLFARYDGVELAHAGTWDLSTGPAEFTPAELASAIDALQCPAIRKPALKLGHDSDLGDGEPSLGWATNLALKDGGRTLVADFVGMPAWLEATAPSAYPDRSVEGFKNFRCQLGHLHPLVIDAVALLGVTRPGIGTLASLQDHARALYAASDDTAGDPVTYTIRASKETTVPDAPTPVAAAVSVDDLREAFRSNAVWDTWIVEVQLNPLQLICTTADGEYVRVPVTLAADGSETFTFGTPIPVEVTYVDSSEPVAASSAANRVTFSSWAPQLRVAASEDQPADPAPTVPSVPADAPPTPQEPAQVPAPTVPPAVEPEPTPEKEGDDMSLSAVRSKLGLPDDADEATVLAKLDERLNPTPDPQLVAASAKSEERFAAAVTQIETLSTELAAIKAKSAADAKAAFFAAATSAGKIAPAEVESWQTRYDRDPELVADIIGAIKPGTAVPVAASGYTGDPDAGRLSDDDLLMLLPPDMRSNDTAKVGA